MKTHSTLCENKKILDYVLQCHIGSGGFGEVWSALAPGGILKAVKVVYGFHDQRRAQDELKALDRVKQLRHPFLLSLERIEVFEGQLIVVTELADKSLAELFDEMISRGEPGIPRDELISLIGNAAEALDYMSEEHGLQHLDIKPENLLLVGKHIKVADFGLSKDLNSYSQSLMSGMTPAYAAPEIFDGRPGKRSDQYSLAILYQEMLTGQRPFAGTTPAQLAAQHLNGKPNLLPLPKTDQSIISKALSKNPEARYPNCRQMVQELSQRKKITRNAIRRLQPIQRMSEDTNQPTISLNLTGQITDATALASSDSLPFQARALKILDPLNLDQQTATCRPTLIVGLGSTGNRIVSLLKKKLVARHGSMESVPAIRLVCIDTDRNDLTRLCMQGGPSDLSTVETIAIPLTKPEVYRERASKKLNWISRRWIYNIPRSLQTEGLRPLGRLAFSDHFETLCNQLESILTDMAKPEVLAATAETLAMNPGELNPRVFFVTSIAGGVGSGMGIDLAYTIKLLLAEQGFESDSLVGLLLHSTYQRFRDPGLSVANTFSFLTEMRHFIEYGYPGDASIGMPDFDEVTPFDFSYIKFLGDDLQQTELEQRLSNTAEYIYLSTASPCSMFFDQCRKQELDNEHFSLRSFDMSLSGPESAIDLESYSHQIITALISRWLNGKPESLAGLDSIREKLNELNLQEDSIYQQFHQQAMEAQQSTEFDPTEFSFESLKVAAETEVLFPGIKKRFDQVYGLIGNNRTTESCRPVFVEQMDEFAQDHATRLSDAILMHVGALLDGIGFDLHGAKQALSHWSKILEAVGEKFNERLTTLKQHELEISNHFASIVLSKLKLKSKESQKLEKVIEQYAEIRHQEFILHFCRSYVRSTIGHLNSQWEMLRQYQQGLMQLANDGALGKQSMSLTDTTELADIEQALLKEIADDVDQQILQTEIQVFYSFVQVKGGYQEILLNPSQLKKLLEKLIATAQQIVVDNFRKLSFDKVIKKNDISPEQINKWLQAQLKASQPTINDCGGGSRPLLGLPTLSGKSLLPELLQKQFAINIQPVNGTVGCFALCLETEDLSLASLAFRLMQLRPDVLELVKRIHTRTDIEWSSLNDLFQAASGNSSCTLKVT
jgi:eukaryotic-like serine/threonine-protein kinase